MTVQNFGVVLSVMLNYVVQGCYKFQLSAKKALPGDYLKTFQTISVVFSSGSESYET